MYTSRFAAFEYTNNYRFNHGVIGRLAQLVERTLSMREVGGSKPPLSTTIFFLFLLLVLFVAYLIVSTLFFSIELCHKSFALHQHFCFNPIVVDK